MSSIVIDIADTHANDTITTPATTIATETQNDNEANSNSVTPSPVSYLGDTTLYMDALFF